MYKIMEKIIKLINNERLKTKISAQKACTVGASDTCSGADYAHCTTYALDNCGKDYSACYNGADDVCGNIDSDKPCFGASVEDNCENDDYCEKTDYSEN